MHRERGFSLVEVMAALVVLTIVITTSLAFFTERARRMQQASETIVAWQALENEAEVQRRIPWGSLDGAAGFTSDTTILDPLQPYAATVVVEPRSPGLKNVKMTVRWANGKREAHLTVIRADTGGGSLW